MKNRMIANMFYEIADMLEIRGSEFKSRAYRKAARSIESLSMPIEDIAKKGELENIPGVGKSISKKIDEIIETGELDYYNELKEKFPIEVEELLSVEGVGPKRVKLFYDELGIENLKQLEKAAKEGKLRELEGMGLKSEQQILDNVKFAKKKGDRALLGYILPIANRIREYMSESDVVEDVEVAGSIRRRRETIGDIDVLVVTKNQKDVMDRFTDMENVAKVVSQGESKSTVVLTDGMDSDLRVIDKKSFGSALMYFTGSKAHNIALRKIAIKNNWKLSEYGLFDGDKRIAGRTEKEIYDKLGMQYIPPEIRENTGEIELALENNLPELIGYGDLRGDLQMHTTWSDGAHSIEEMAETAKDIGHDYICITDHFGNLKVAGGMDPEDLDDYFKDIEKVEENVGIRILRGVEVDIMSDAKLGVDDRYLEDMDIVIASIHSGFRQKKEKIMKRLVTAMENEHVDIIAHPTGRKIQKRRGYDVDIEKLFKVSKRTNTLLEINSYPERMDIDANTVRAAIEHGCNTVINTDSHSKNHLRFIELGIANARRGWATKGDVINTMSHREVLKFFGK